MTDFEKKMIGQFISQRQEIVFNRLNENLRYREICDRQKRIEADADEILHKLEKDERITVRRYYEGETEKTGIELNEVYIQGLRDSVRILALLGVFGTETDF